MLKLAKIFLIGSLYVFGLAHAATCSSAAVPAPEQKLFVVSGVLKRNGEEGIIKLIQGVERANSSSAALGSFVGKSLDEFSGYSLATTLVSEIPGSAATSCTRPTLLNGA